MRLIFFFLFVSILSGCGTRGAVYIEDLSIAIHELQRVAIDSLPLGKREQSANERELYSEYFVEKGGEYVAARGVPTRRYAHITILGDRRPYKIEVQVIVESRGSRGEYSHQKYDEGMARVITRRIQNALHKRREDRNIIDDFRVF